MVHATGRKTASTAVVTVPRARKRCLRAPTRSAMASRPTSTAAATARRAVPGSRVFATWTARTPPAPTDGVEVRARNRCWPAPGAASTRASIELTAEAAACRARATRCVWGASAARRVPAARDRVVAPASTRVRTHNTAAAVAGRARWEKSAWAACADRRALPARWCAALTACLSTSMACTVVAATNRAQRGPPAWWGSAPPGATHRC